MKRRSFFKALISLSALGALNSCGLKMKRKRPRFIWLHEFGSPSRWMFDLFLNPYEGCPLIDNPMVATKFSQERGKLKRVYETKSFNNIQIPPIWFENVHTPKGEVPLHHLLANWQTVRGLSTGNASHTHSSLNWLNPFHESQNIWSAINRDLSPGVFIGSFKEAFAPFQTKEFPLSPMGKDSNLVADTYLPFYKLGTSHDIQKDLTSFLNILDQKKSPHLEYLANLELPDLYQFWDKTYNKYEGLIRKTLYSKPIKGLTEFAISPLGPMEINKRQVEHNDLREIFKNQPIPGNMAAIFTFIEFASLYSTSHNLALQLTSFEDLLIKDKTFGPIKWEQDFDEHRTSATPSLLINSLYYLALGSALATLKETLQENHLWSDTLIMLGGEFNRTPRRDETGSDHAWQGASFSLLGGSVSPLKVSGDILTQEKKYSSRYPGTFGDGIGSLPISKIASSLAMIFDIDKWKPEESLFQYQKGKLICRLDEAKNRQGKI